MKTSMNIGKARFTLFVLFVVPLAACIILTYANHRYTQSDDRTDLLWRVFAIYSVPLGILTGSVIQQRDLRRRRVPREAFWMIVVLSTIWNGLIIYSLVDYIVSPAITDSHLEDLDSFLNKFSGIASGLTGGLLTYMFLQAKGKTTNNKPG